MSVMSGDEIIFNELHNNRAIPIFWFSSLKSIAFGVIEGWNNVFEITHVR